MEIRDSRLYRETHKMFEDYCRKRWGMGRRYANRTIEAAGIAEDLGPFGPTNEAQVRELARLSTEDRRKVWAMVTAPGSPTPTASGIRKVKLKLGLLDPPRKRKPRREADGISCSLRATVIVTTEPTRKSLRHCSAQTRRIGN